MFHFYFVCSGVGENKTPGSTYHIKIRKASAIVFGDGSNLKKITQPQEGHATARQREGYKERYQRRREQNEKEKRHGCLNTDVLPYVPADHQQCQQSLNPGHAEAIVDTGRL